MLRRIALRKGRDEAEKLDNHVYEGSQDDLPACRVDGCQGSVGAVPEVPVPRFKESRSHSGGFFIGRPNFRGDLCAIEC